MNFVINKQLTNTRPPKVDVAQLVTTPTPGNMRLSEKASDLLGLKKGDYVGVVVAEVDGAEKFFIHKGWSSDEGNVGSKVSTTGGRIAGGSMLFSSANVYNTLGGNSEMNRIFDIAEDGVNHEGVVYHELTFNSEVPKAERNFNEEDEAEANAELAKN